MSESMLSDVRVLFIMCGYSDDDVSLMLGYVQKRPEPIALVYKTVMSFPAIASQVIYKLAKEEQVKKDG